MIKIYVYAKCSTCRNALKWLEDRAIAHEVHPIRDRPPSIQELRQVLGHLDGQLTKLFNTSGLDYRAMGLKDRLPKLGIDEALKLLNKNGNLIKRPLVIGKNTGLAGFKVTDWQKALMS